ncbi:LysR substrate-binding domain-containing protein [Pendulispora brunnea]|uniref:LysR substrate-binding domain-containing protein n=1 Tax=Pendulispora brunnea TaxID=2905690 RepID=A0ABZ2JVV6_9BACT
MLGLRLFERSRTGARPTEAGANVISKAREALDVLDAIGIASENHVLRGTVRIGAYRSVATHLLTPLVHALGKRHPALRIEIDDACDEREAVERAVRDGRVDLGIAHLPVASGFTVTPFAEDDYVVVVTSQHTPRSTPAMWTQLANLPFLELKCSGARRALETCRASGMTNRSASSFSSESTILAQIVTRAGFSILPRLAIEPLPKGLTVVPLPSSAVRSLAMIRRSDRRGTLVRIVAVELRTALGRTHLAASHFVRPA